MVLKPNKTLLLLDAQFESSVIFNGTQTGEENYIVLTPFESSVIFNGTQTIH